MNCACEEKSWETQSFAPCGFHAEKLRRAYNDGLADGRAERAEPSGGSCAAPPPDGEATAAAGRSLAEDCPRCGHLVVLHSLSRGCVGCHAEPGVTR